MRVEHMAHSVDSCAKHRERRPIGISSQRPPTVSPTLRGQTPHCGSYHATAATHHCTGSAIVLRSLAQDPGAADDDLIASGRRRRRRNTPEDSVTRSPWRFISSSHTRFARSCVVCRILIHGDHSPQRCRTLGTRCVCGSWALKWQHRRHGSVCSTRVGHGGCGRTGFGMACGWCGHGPKGLWRCGDAVRSFVLTCAGAGCSPSSVTLRLKHLRQRCYAVLDCRPCSYRR